MPSGKKRKRAKISTHKRKKKSQSKQTQEKVSIRLLFRLSHKKENLRSLKFEDLTIKIKSSFGRNT